MDQFSGSPKSTHGSLTFNRPLTAGDIERLRVNTAASFALEVPTAVRVAYSRANTLGFIRSSDPVWLT